MRALVGLDFDNTIAGYGRLFPLAAVREGLIEPNAAHDKTAVRKTILSRPEGEQAWMRLQGRVYGAHMHEAELIAGVDQFLVRCRAVGVRVVIVSHKTEFGHFDPDRVNLRRAARDWLEDKGFFAPDGFGFGAEDVYFEPTREDKIARIRTLGCSHFVDDLEEIFAEPDFPAGVRKFLLAPGTGALPRGPFLAFRTWPEISDAIFASFD